MLLKELHPSVVVSPHRAVRRRRHVITSADVSAGIDMALHLVARLGGVERACDVRRDLQYDPQPPV